MATADHIADDELKPEQTEGFKVGEKKTIDEYHKLGMPVSISVSSSFLLAQTFIF